MAESVFGGSEAKPEAGGVFADNSQPAAVSGDVFSAAAPVVPQEKKPLPWKKIMKIGIPVLAVLLLGGGVLAFFLVQNSDDKIIGDALANLLKDNEVKVDGEVSITNLNSAGDKINVKFGVESRSDIEGRNGEASVDLRVRPTISGIEGLDGSQEFSGKLQAAYVDESFFVRMDYLQVAQQVIDMVAPEMGTEWPEEATRYNDRWLMVSNQTLTDLIGSSNDDLQECLQNEAQALRGNKKAARELYRIMTTIVKFERESKSGGTAVYSVAPSTVLSDYYDFMRQVYDSGVVRGFVGCMDDFQVGASEDFYEMLSRAIEQYEEMTADERERNERSLKETMKSLPKVTVEISTRARRFTGLTVKGSMNEMRFEIGLKLESKHDKSVSIVAPEGYLELTVNDLNGFGDLDINSILNAGQTATQRNATDRVIAQLNQYMADNQGRLPTLELGYGGEVMEDDTFFEEYLASGWDPVFTLRVLNDDGSKEFPGSYGAMTNSGPFFLQNYSGGGYSSIRYSRYGDMNGDLWLVYGARCSDEVASTVDRVSGGSSVAITTYLGDGQYYCADNS
ncbi:hypothetical protein FWG86_01550 [Candidatus Saccharibacteria bacterium]|nr:hypothetical protein [Candidatus Saccharibacteria bacterium]